MVNLIPRFVPARRRQHVPSPQLGDDSSVLELPTRRARFTGRVRRMGQGLALPITAMPAAGLMLRLGQDDLLGRVDGLRSAAAVLSGAGAAVLDYLPVLFAIGIALGLSRAEDRAGPVVACVVSYLVLSRAVLVLNPLPEGQDIPPARWPYGALTGIVAGLLAVAVWNRVDGRRRIPSFAAYGIVCAAALAAGSLLGLAYPAVNHALTASAGALADHPVIGGGAFGFFNRLAVPIGLHHVPNTVVWFVAGECGDGIRGDIPCFFMQKDPDAGIFMTGFFPVAMAGLPAAAIAMWRSAPPESRRRIAGILLPAAAMSAIAGITEPIELAFAFTAAPLYLLHAALTGASLALVNALDIHSGFVFSAGALDYVFNYPISQRPLLLLPVSAVYGLLYYVLFRFAITRFNLSTPGRTRPDRTATRNRETTETAAAAPAASDGSRHQQKQRNPHDRGDMYEQTVQTAHYGLGNFFPVIVLDPQPRWSRPAPPALPALASTIPAEVLAIRWTGDDPDAADAVQLLVQAGRDAPAELVPERLDQYRAALPPSLNLVTLPPTALIGPWADRPGAARRAGMGRVT